VALNYVSYPKGPQHCGSLLAEMCQVEMKKYKSILSRTVGSLSVIEIINTEEREISVRQISYGKPRKLRQDRPN